MKNARNETYRKKLNAFKGNRLIRCAITDVDFSVISYLFFLLGS